MADNVFHEGEWINGRYQIRSILGFGSFGTTYKVLDKTRAGTYALKVFDFGRMSDWKDYDLFERECNILKNIEHPNIPRYVDHFRIEKPGHVLFALVQEYIKGETLEQRVLSGKKFSLFEIKGIAKKLLNVLKYIHELQPPIIHRDINPKNILVDTQGKPYLLDFGTAGNIRKENAAGSMTFVGTAGYIPMEQYYGKASPASDIYALGMTIFFALSGKNPGDLFPEEAHFNFKDYLHVPDNFLFFLEKTTAPEVKHRAKNAQEALGALEGWLLPKSQRAVERFGGETTQNKIVRNQNSPHATSHLIMAIFGMFCVITGPISFFLARNALKKYPDCQVTRIAMTIGLVFTVFTVAMLALLLLVLIAHLR